MFYNSLIITRLKVIFIVLVGVLCFLIMNIIKIYTKIFFITSKTLEIKGLTLDLKMRIFSQKNTILSLENKILSLSEALNDSTYYYINIATDAIVLVIVVASLGFSLYYLCAPATVISVSPPKVDLYSQEFLNKKAIEFSTFITDDETLMSFDNYLKDVRFLSKAFNENKNVFVHSLKESAENMWCLFCKFDAVLKPDDWPDKQKDLLNVSDGITQTDVSQAIRVYDIYIQNHETINKTAALINDYLGLN